MSLVSKTYTFTNGSTADAQQVNTDFDTLFTLLNGGLDTTNMAIGGINDPSKIANETVTAPKTEGLAYAQDVYIGSCVISGLTVTKDGTYPNQIDTNSGVAYIKQPDGSLRRLNIVASTQKTISASATYYLDLNHDGTWWFSTGHSTDPNYLNLATVTTDASGNVATVTKNTISYQVQMNGTTTPQTIQDVMYWMSV